MIKTIGSKAELMKHLWNGNAVKKEFLYEAVLGSREYKTWKHKRDRKSELYFFKKFGWVTEGGILEKEI